MYSDRSIKITEEEYNYLLPAIPKKIGYSGQRYFAIVNSDDTEDVMNRMKGLYGYFDELPSMLAHKCFTNRTFQPFRDFLRI